MYLYQHTTANDKMPPNLREPGLTILTNKRSDFKNRDVQKFFNSFPFCYQSSPITPDGY